MQNNKRQRTLVDFNIPRTNVLLPRHVKKQQTTSVYIDLETEDYEEQEVAALEKITNESQTGHAAIETKSEIVPLFVEDDDSQNSLKSEDISPAVTLLEEEDETEVKSEANWDSEKSISQNNATLPTIKDEGSQRPPSARNVMSLTLGKPTKPITSNLRRAQVAKKGPVRKIKRGFTESPGPVVRNVVSVMEVGQEQQLLCPVCGVVLTKLELHEREVHCDQCLQSGAPPAKKRPGRALPKLPEVKKIHFKNHSIIVDGFNYDSDSAIKQYFLSHFHADHYMGVKKSWAQGSIYCSKVTADLLSYKFKVPEERIVALPAETSIQISSNVSVICFDANHCPGAFVFLFREVDGNDETVQWVLHTGDFRSNDDLIERVMAHTGGSPVDKVYLDTTYMYPSYHFPLQKSVLEVTGDFACKLREEGFKKLFGDRQSSIMSYLSNPLKRRPLHKYVFVVGTYTIGKEKLAIAIAEKLNTKIFIPKDTARHQIVRTYEHKFPEGIITHDITKSCVHLVSIRTLSSKESLQFYFKPISHIYEDMVAFSPTGWSFKNGGRFIKLHESLDQKIDHTMGLLSNKSLDVMDPSTIYKQYKREARFQVFRVPYSEHSSFKDLANFCVRLPWISMIPTVNTHNDYMISQMQEWFQAWKAVQQKQRL